MGSFKLNNDKLRRMVAQVLHEQSDNKGVRPISREHLNKIILEELEEYSRPGREPGGPGKKVSTGMPNMEEWWNEDPDEVMSFVYWLKGQLPPSDPEKKAAAWESLAQQLEKRHPSPSGIQEGMPHEISYSDVNREYDAILGFLKDDLLKRVGSKYLADALELLSSDVRDGVHDPKSGTAWDDKGVQETEEEQQGEEEVKTGTGEQRDAAKEQGFKPDVVKVAKFMFKHKQLGPALGKLKGDKIESAQLMVLLAQELGIEAGELQKMQVQMKAAMTKAEK